MAERAPFTAGPWDVEDPMGPDGLTIVEAGKKTYEWRFIASIDIAAEDENPIPRAEAEANARLIAAAPDLYDALSRALTEMEFLCRGHSDAEIKIARAALAKAVS